MPNTKFQSECQVSDYANKLKVMKYVLEANQAKLICWTKRVTVFLTPQPAEYNKQNI